MMFPQHDPLDAPAVVETISMLHRDARTLIAFDPDEEWVRMAEDLDAIADVQYRVAEARRDAMSRRLAGGIR